MNALCDSYDLDKNHIIFKYYEAAHRWSLQRSKVIIPRNPNTNIIASLLSEDLVIGNSISDFIYFLDGRWQERKIEQRSEVVNLAWLILSECDDEIMKDGILSSEGDSELTLKSINEMLEDYTLMS